MGAIFAVIEASTQLRQSLVEQACASSHYRGQPHTASTSNATFVAQESCEEGLLLEDGHGISLLNGYVRTPTGAATRDALSTIHQAATQGSLASLLEQLDGEFSIIHHTYKSGEILVACSLFGTRPLYYRHQTALVIGTEIRQVATKQNGKLPPIRYELLPEYLLFQQTLSDPEAIYFEGVKRIVPGRLYRFTINPPTPHAEQQAFWNPPARNVLETKPPKEASAQLLKLIKESLAGSLSSRPTHMALSGGLDSSTLWCLLSQSSDPRTSQIGAASQVFKGQTCDESLYLDALEKKCKKPITRIDHSDMWSSEHIEQMTGSLDYLIWPNAYYLERYLPALASFKNEILLLGFGSDELLSPGIAYLSDDIENGQWLSSIHRAMIRRQAGRKRKPHRQALTFLSQVVRPSDTVAGHLIRKLKPHQSPPWIHPARQTELTQLIQTRDQLRRDSGHARHRILEQLAWHGSIGIAPYEQRAAMAGQVIRNPFLSKHILEFALRTPPQTLLPAGRQEKELLRIATRGLVPDDILDRRSRTEFGTYQTLDPELVLAHGKASDWELSKHSVINTEFVQKELQQINARQKIPSWLAFLGCAEHFAKRHACND